LKIFSTELALSTFFFSILIKKKKKEKMNGVKNVVKKDQTFAANLQV